VRTKHDILDSLSPDYVRERTRDAEPLAIPIYEGVRRCVSSDLPQIRKDVLREQHGAMRKERPTQQGSWYKPKTKTTASVARERNGVMTKLEELEAKRAAAEAAVNAAADTAWDEAVAAYAAYDAAWDAVDAYKAELKKQQGEIIP
jgi:hypothetical protein